MHKIPSLKQIFPQYTRFFPAKSFEKAWRLAGKFPLWIGISLLLVVNIGMYTKQSPLAWKIVSPMKPFLETIYLRANGAHGVLGVSTDQIQQGVERQKERDSLDRQYVYWQSVVDAHPDFRDGYLTLASLAYQLNKPTQMRGFLDRAKQIDPNNEMLKRLLALLPKT